MKLIEKYHNDELYGGHHGQKKVYAKLRQNFFWKNMARDVANYVKNCTLCKLSNPNKKTIEQLTLTKTPCKPFDIIQVDTIGPLQKSNDGNIYAVTIIDEMSKWLTIVPIPQKTAVHIAKAIFEGHILTFGPMKEIKSDMGTEYRNEVVKELCKLLKIEQIHSTAYHHETVGQIERNHRTLNEYLRKFLNGKLDNWDKYTQYFQFLYNISKNSTLDNKYSPFEIVYLRKCNMPHEIMTGNVDKLYNVDDYVKETKIKLQLVFNETVELINKMKERNKKLHDQNVNPIQVKIGDIVKIKKEPYDKFRPIYDGPFEVLEVKDSNITVKKNGNPYDIHKNRIIKY